MHGTDRMQIIMRGNHNTRVIGAVNVVTESAGGFSNDNQHFDSDGMLGELVSCNAYLRLT